MKIYYDKDAERKSTVGFIEYTKTRGVAADDFTRIQKIIKPEWRNKAIRLSLWLKYENIDVVAAGYTGTVTINYEIPVSDPDEPSAGWKQFAAFVDDLLRIPITKATERPVQTIEKRAWSDFWYHTELAEAARESGWKFWRFADYRIPPFASTDKPVILRIGLHGVTGKLSIDDVKLELCD